MIMRGARGLLQNHLALQNHGSDHKVLIYSSPVPSPEQYDGNVQTMQILLLHSPRKYYFTESSLAKIFKKIQQNLHFLHVWQIHSLVVGTWQRICRNIYCFVSFSNNLLSYIIHRLHMLSKRSLDIEVTIEINLTPISLACNKISIARSLKPAKEREE